MPERPQKIEQALFGYDDGHRLLDSSTRLLGSERERLLLLTDLGPGLSGLRADGYWTGAPLPETERYALMRTWPAPEMSRPGCVWTHVLLIPFEYIRSVWTLEGLTQWVVRPSGVNFGPAYSRSLSTEEIEHSDVQRDEVKRNGWDVVSCLYYTDCTGGVPSSQDALGMMAMKIWSQQWPELRCGFSFRTIGKPSLGKSTLLTFDMGVTEGQLQFQKESPAASLYLMNHRGAKVREALADDLVAPAETDLRAFVHLYGEDFPKHGVWVAFLASVRERLGNLRMRPQEYRALLEDVAQALPLRNDGLRLKANLLTDSPESSFELPLDWFVEALEYFGKHPLDEGLPELQITEPLIAQTWQTRRDQLLRVVRALAAQNSSPQTTRLMEALSRMPYADDLMESLTDLPDVRRALVKSNTALLQSERLLRVPSKELLTWIADLSEEQVRELGLIPRLLASTSTEIAESLCDRFPGEVLRAVCIGRGRLGPSLEVHDHILQFAGKVAARFLQVEFLNSLDTTSALYSFGSMLGFVNSKTIAVGSVVWVPSLRKATKDSTEAQTQVLSAFLMALALARPQQGSEFIFEYSFDLLHRAMRDSALDYQASVILEGQLPEVSWWRRWDSCQRLRLAVVRAFVHGEMNPESFLQLTRDTSVMSQMFEQLESMEDARFYLDRVRQQLSAAKHQGD
jgi:hypothetical protein